jgi:hypothetical protein
MGRGEGLTPIDFDVQRFGFDDALDGLPPALTPELAEKISAAAYNFTKFKEDELNALVTDPTFKRACAESPDDEAFDYLAKTLIGYVLRSEGGTVRNYSNRIAVCTGALRVTTDIIVTPEGWAGYCLRESPEAMETLCGKSLKKGYKTNFRRGTFNQHRNLGICESCDRKVREEKAPGAYNACWEPDPYNLPYAYTDALEKEATTRIIRTLGALSKDDPMKVKVARRLYKYLHATVPTKMSEDIWALEPEERFERVFALITNEERSKGIEVLKVRNAIIEAYGQPASLDWGSQQTIEECIRKSISNGIGTEHGHSLRFAFYEQLIAHLWPGVTYAH